MKTKYIVIPLLVIGLPLVGLFIAQSKMDLPRWLDDIAMMGYFGFLLVGIAILFIGIHIWEAWSEKKFRRKLRRENDDRLH